MTTILLLQGANMAYLGKRQPEIYGTTPAAELDRMMQRHAKKRGVKLEIYYTHIEGEAIERIYRAADERIDGLLMNRPDSTMPAMRCAIACVRCSFPMWKCI